MTAGDEATSIQYDSRNLPFMCRLGINKVPVQQVSLPYKGYQTVDDLLNFEGRAPSWWRFMTYQQ